MAEPTGNTSFVTQAIQRAFPGRRRSKTPSQVTALDIDGSLLRVVHAVPRGDRIEVLRIEAARLEMPVGADRSDGTETGKSISRALQALGIKPASVVMGVPRAQVILRTLLLPVIKDVAELASVVHIQVARDLPFRMEDAVVDFKVRRQVSPAPLRTEGSLAGTGAEQRPDAPPAPRLEVLVAAVKREAIDYLQQIADVAGFKLQAIGLLPYANARCVEACRVADGVEAFALVSLRPDEVTIDVISEQSLLFSRSSTIHLPVEPAVADAAGSTAAGPETGPSRSEIFAEAVTIEVVRSLHAYSGMEPNLPAAKIVVSGASGCETAVVESIGRRLSLPCAQLDPAADLGVVGASREVVAGATAAIGLALGMGDPRGLPFDFLNPKRPQVPRDMGRIRILAGTAAAVALFVLILAIRTHLINQRTAVNRAVAAELAEAEKNRPIYRKMMQQAAAAEEWARPGSDWLAHYAYLSAILPPSEDVYLTSFSVTASGVIRMSVQARSGEVLAKLDKQLRAAGYDVKPLAITPGADRHGYEFRSNVDLAVTEKLKIDLAQVRAPARPSDDASLDPVLPRGGR